jgi:hypothetical protein
MQMPTVPESASKFRPVPGCTNFNSGDPPGRQDCVIFGGSPEARESARLDIGHAVAGATIRRGARMGFLNDLFGFGKRDILESLNLLSDMKLREFVIADDSSENLRHYIRFKNREAQDEEFIVIYQRAGGDMLRYARTHWRRPGQEKDFRTLNERSSWSPAI